MSRPNESALGLAGQEGAENSCTGIQTAQSVAPPPGLVNDAPLMPWAQEYARQGFQPVRIASNGKAPIDSGWQLPNPDAVARFVAHTGNIGISLPVGVVVLDIDTHRADGFASVQELEAQLGALPPTRFAATQGGGEHRLYRLPPGVILKNGTAVAPGLDIKTAGGQIVVEPSTIDGRPYRWRDWSAAIAELPAAWAARLAAGAPATRCTAPADPQSPIPEGMRNTTLTSIAGTLRGHGLNEVHIAEVLARINDERCDPPLDEGEIAQIAGSVARYAPAPQPWEIFGRGAPLPAGATAPSTLYGADVSLEDRSPLSFNPWVLFVPEGELTLLAGHGGAGKSILALLLALCIATGRPFLGLATRRGRVLIYSAEDPAKPLRIRLHALCQRYGIDLAELRGWLTITDMTEGDPVLYRGTGPTEAFVRLRERVERERFDVVILDNASDVFDGNENERPRVRHFVRLCRQLVAAREGAVILLTHVDKSTAKGFSGGQGYSGSTAWHNSARSRLFLVREEDGTITLEHLKANNGPLASPIRLRWEGRVPVPFASDPAAAADAALWSVFALVWDFNARGENVPTATSGPSTAYHLFSSAEGYPRGMRAAQLFDVLRTAERRQLIHREIYTANNRNQRERWRPVISGDALVVRQSLTNAPLTQPTS